MRKEPGFYFLTFAACLLLASGAAADDRAGTAGGLFLRLADPPRTAAMGGAEAANSEGVFAAWGNPAGTIRQAAREVGFARIQSFADISVNMIGYSQPVTDRDVLVLSYTGADFGAIEGRDITGRPTGNVRTGDDAAGLTWGHRFGESLSVGATVRYLASRLGRHRATAWTGDLGVHWRTPVRGLSLGGSAENLFGDLTFVREKSRLPRTFRIGAAQSLFEDRVLLAADLVKGVDTDWEFAGGVEARVVRYLFLRAGGTTARDEGEAWTLGIGLRFRRFALDYAFLPFGDLGDQHRASLRAEF